MEKISHRSYDFFGNIALVKFPDNFPKIKKIEFAKDLIKKENSIKTVLEKIGKFKGRLRKMQTSYLAGEKNKEVLYRENGCVFRFNIDTTYFSPRLSNERKEIYEQIKKEDEVLVLFAGVSPFSVVIAKNSRPKKVYSNELNREANKYAKLNISLNKVSDIVELLPGDSKKVCKKLSGSCKKFDVIVMPRPQLKDSFLDSVFLVSKKGTRIFYYDFCKVSDFSKIIDKVNEEAKKAGKKIKIINQKLAGEIAPYKSRVRVDFVVL